jgi:hypothetical protein
MDLDRMSTGEKIADAAAVLLFIFMFFEWFSVDFSGGEGLFTVSGGFNAWESFSFIDIVLFVTVLAAVAVAIVRLTDALVEPPVSVNAVVAILGGISVLLILYRIISPPGFDGASDVPGVDVSPSIGVFLGLIAAVGIAYGGYRAMQEEGTSFGDLGDQFSSRGGPGAGTPQPPSSTTPPPPPPPPSGGQGGPPPQ